MEPNVWMPLFARAVTFLSSLLKSSDNQRNQSSGGSSPNAPENAAGLISTSPNVETLAIIRNPAFASKDGIFGTMTYQNETIGFTMERVGVAISEGIYRTHMETSPHFGFVTPHLSVEGRTCIEIHPANYPTQLEGCISVGTTIDNDTLDNSDAAFEKMMKILPQEFLVKVSSL